MFDFNVSIYCLIDPRTDKPFYVGCTKVKLSDRLSQHMHEARNNFIINANGFCIDNYPERTFKNVNIRKCLVILEILLHGKKPIIKLLKSCHFDKSDHYEKFYYYKLSKTSTLYVAKTGYKAAYISKYK